MDKIVFLRIDGNLNDGVEMSLQICENGSPLPDIPLPEKGRLKPNPELEGCYLLWLHDFVNIRSHRYRLYKEKLRGVEPDDWEFDEVDEEVRVTNVGVFYDEDACLQYVKLTEEKFKDWLSESGDRHWMSIREILVGQFAKNSENVAIVIQAKETDLWKFPWYAWDLLERYPNVGIGFSFPSGKRVSNLRPIQPNISTSHKVGILKVRILVVLGSDRDIDLDPDKQAILNLPQADPHFLSKPTAQELNQTLRDKQGWDIFLFAGHSESDKHKERIYISEDEFVEIADFKNSLTEAIRYGLKVAIFNSCQGMGLAERLADLHLPFSIVMQEPVPDLIAQAFLKEFLTEYSEGKFLYTAVRLATKRLEDFNKKWPGATWLPIICQNPSEFPPSWQDLLRPIPEPKPTSEPDVTYALAIPAITPRKISPFTKNWRRRLGTVVLTSLVMAGLVIGVRWVGLLEPFELQAYDHLMRMRPAEKPAETRILVINDFQSQPDNDSGPTSISAPYLTQLLEKLESSEPRAIGLHLDRHFLDPDKSAVLANLIQSDLVINMCQYSLSSSKRSIMLAPPGVKPENLGFTNMTLDTGNILRRHILLLNEAELDCNTKYSFAYQLAKQYLFKQKIKLEINDDDEPQAGSVVLKKITHNSGGYSKIHAGAYQLMINYRSNLEDIARTVSLRDFLEDRIPLAWVKDRLVLIGNTHGMDKDTWQTPYSSKTSGTEIQVNLINQIISAVLDERHLIWWWPELVELVWICCWSFFGGLLILTLRKPQYLFFSFGGSLVLLYVICWRVMAHSAAWIPLIPPALAFLSTGFVLFSLFFKLSRI